MRYGTCSSPNGEYALTLILLGVTQEMSRELVTVSEIPPHYEDQPSTHCVPRIGGTEWTRSNANEAAAA